MLETKNGCRALQIPNSVEARRIRSNQNNPVEDRLAPGVPTSLYHEISQHVALNLAAPCHRQFAEPLHKFRQLVVSNLVTKKGDELFSRRHDVTLGNDAEAIALAEAEIWNAYHCRVHDLGMGVENLFHLAWKELLSAAVYDLLAAAGDLHIAAGIDHSPEIAGAEPALLVESKSIGGWIVVIAEMDRRTARHQFANLSWRNVVSVRIDNAQLHGA